MNEPSFAQRRLREADARIDAQLGRARRTLDPEREHATSLADLGARHLSELDDERAETFVAGVVALAESIAEAFPENVFWDLDALVAQALRDCPDPASLAERFDDLRALQRQFGRDTKIAFRYVHDFIYGYDWAKWLKRHPEHANDTPPFGARFLTRMKTRGEELLELIAADDAKYPTLPDGQARNPFPFSRELGDEATLHRELARRDLVPVRAWLPSPAPDWDRPYADLRVEVARELGLAR